MLTILCKKKRYIKALRYGKLESLFQKNHNVEISKNKCFTDSLHRKTKLIQRLAYDCKNFALRQTQWDEEERGDKRRRKTIRKRERQRG